MGGWEIGIGAGVAAGACADEGTVAGAAGAVSGAGTDDGGASTDIAIHAAARPAGTRKERQNAFVIICTVFRRDHVIRGRRYQRNTTFGLG